MKAITLTQPWATLVAIGAKQFETRSWRPAYRGPIAIHAAKDMPRSADDLTLRKPFYDVLRAAGYDGVHTLLPQGAILAVGDLTWCRSTDRDASSHADRAWFDSLGAQELAFGDYSPGRWAWRLENVRQLAEPVPARGYQFLWDLEPAVADALRQQVGATP